MKTKIIGFTIGPYCAETFFIKQGRRVMHVDASGYCNINLIPDHRQIVDYRYDKLPKYICRLLNLPLGVWFSDEGAIDAFKKFWKARRHVIHEF